MSRRGQSTAVPKRSEPWTSNAGRLGPRVSDARRGGVLTPRAYRRMLLSFVAPGPGAGRGRGEEEVQTHPASLRVALLRVTGVACCCLTTRRQEAPPAKRWQLASSRPLPYCSRLEPNPPATQDIRRTWVSYPEITSRRLLYWFGDSPVCAGVQYVSFT